MQWAGFEVVGVDISHTRIIPVILSKQTCITYLSRLTTFSLCGQARRAKRFRAHQARKTGKLTLILFPLCVICWQVMNGQSLKNVPNSPVRPDVVLTGQSVGLPYLHRKRHFETSFFMMYPPVSIGLSDKRYWTEGKAICVTTKMQ